MRYAAWTAFDIEWIVAIGTQMGRARSVFGCRRGLERLYLLRISPLAVAPLKVVTMTPVLMINMMEVIAVIKLQSKKGRVDTCRMITILPIIFNLLPTTVIRLLIFLHLLL